MALTPVLAPAIASEGPIPISDCLLWTFEPDDSDVVSTPGVAASLVIVFPSSPSAPANGTEFVMWGHVMEIQSGTPFTARTFKVEAADANGTIGNFVDMVSANYFFASAVTVSVDYGTRTVTLTWNECGEQPNFGSEQMDFAAITGTAITSATPTNGTTPVYVDGYKFVYRMLRTDIVNDANSGFVTAFESMEPNKDCTGGDDVGFNGMPTARRLLKTYMPALDNNHPTITFDGPIQYFSLQYGWVYRDANANAMSGEFAFTNRSAVWNAYFEPYDVYKVRRYWPGATGGLPPGQTLPRMLTQQPNSHYLLKKSKAWLYYMINDAVQSYTNLRMRVVVEKIGGGTVSSTFIVPNSSFGINAVNTSPSFVVSLGLSGVTIDNIESYACAIFTQNSATPTDVTQITEAHIFYVMQVCDSAQHTDIYFLDKLGGIGTLPVEIIEETANQVGDEILLDVPCSASREDKARYGGRTLGNIRSNISYTLRTFFKGGDEYLDFFRSMKLSPQRWIRTTDETGAFVARKFIVEPGGVKVFQEGPRVSLEVSGYMGDIVIQSGSEPEI